MRVGSGLTIEGYGRPTELTDNVTRKDHPRRGGSRLDCQAVAPNLRSVGRRRGESHG